MRSDTTKDASGQSAQSASEKAKDTEIERKYLVGELPDLKEAVRHAILQGYLAVDADGTEVRLRRKGDRRFLTVKSGAGEQRGEIEREIPEALFAALWPATAGKRIEKTRYELKYQEYLIELDLYQGDLTGLQVAEVEFESMAQSAAFVPPPWFGPEVTQESAYKNHQLALHGNPEKS